MTPDDLQQQIDAILKRAVEAQNRASDPDTSVWVSANAGTGKTKVLTDRILRLLLNGARVADILAVTYTRTAAQEMRNRVFETLAKWAVTGGKGLDASINRIGIEKPTQKQRDRARQLFATLLDQPQGLRIETVHAFSQSVLRRFPVEAGVQPYFDLATDAQAAVLKKETATGLLRHHDPLVIEALAAMALRHNMEPALGFVDRMQAFPQTLKDFSNDPVGFKKQLYASLGCEDAATDPAGAQDKRLRAVFDLDDNRRRDLRIIVATMRAHGKKTDQEKADAIEILLDETRPHNLSRLDLVSGGFLKADGGLFTKAVTNDVVANLPQATDIMVAEAERIQEAYQQLHAIDTAQQSFHLVTIAAAMAEGYAAAKTRAGLMDYDDLIETANALLHARGGAAWVRYKLDRGINHLLIDEAQDTSPRQWQILTALAGEFFTGDEDQEQDQPRRSLFSVGDYKQSIYSFQGARPDLFDQQETRFRQLAEEAQKPFARIDLATSFRSTAPVLDCVDRVTTSDNADGTPAFPGLGALTGHEVFRLGQGGFVDVMDVVSQADLPDDGSDARDVLARQIVTVIQNWVGTRYLPARGRVMKAGDILILLRDRQQGGLYRVLDRELRLAGLPVAGADRIKLNDDIAVRDLLALGRVVLLPEDDLTLATVLKSPLFGLDEDDLFRLAHGRGEVRLFQQLAQRSSEDETFAKAYEKLTAYLNLAEHSSVYGFFSTVLDSPTRQAFSRRLGNYVSDVLAEFLETARQYEMIAPASMLGFVEDFENAETEIRRESETRSRDEIRIMTIHGAKGLEAPVVILPDALRKDAKTDTIIPVGEGLPLLQIPGRCLTPQVAAAQSDAAARQQQEEDRLFYVAMTRAEDGLLVAGFENSRRRRKRDGSFYAAVEAALAKADLEKGQVAAVKITDENGLSFLRLETPQVFTPEPVAERPETEVEMAMPPWLHNPAPLEETPPRPLSPSRFGVAEQAQSPVGDDRRKAMERGVLAHRLLEILPRLEGETRLKAAARTIDAGRHHLTPDEAEAMLSRVIDLIETPSLAPFFAAEARAEVPVSGLVGETVVSGVIDRLVVGEDHITLIDFKTGAPPSSERGVSSAYVSQMGLYRHLVGQIWPDRFVEAGLLYTEDASLHWIDAAEMDAVVAEMVQQS